MFSLNDRRIRTSGLTRRLSDDRSQMLCDDLVVSPS